MKKILIFILLVLVAMPLFASYSTWELFNYKVTLRVGLELGRDHEYKFKDCLASFDVSFPYHFWGPYPNHNEEAVMNIGLSLDAGYDSDSEATIGLSAFADYDVVEKAAMLEGFLGAVKFGTAIVDGRLVASTIGLDFDADIVFSDSVSITPCVELDCSLRKDRKGSLRIAVESSQEFAVNTLVEAAEGTFRIVDEDVHFEDMSLLVDYERAIGTIRVGGHIKAIQNDGILFGADGYVPFSCGRSDRYTGSLEFMIHPGSKPFFTIESGRLNAMGCSDRSCMGFDITYADGILAVSYCMDYRFNPEAQANLAFIMDMAFKGGFTYKTVLDMDIDVGNDNERISNLARIHGSWALFNTMDNDLLKFDLGYDMYRQGL